jgi:hypothetical protein
MRFLGRLFPSFDGTPHYTSPYFYIPPKKRWWPFLAGCALGGVVVLVLFGGSNPPADSSGDRTHAYHVRGSHPDKFAAKKAKQATTRAESQSEKSSVQVVPMAEALSEASGTAKSQAAEESVRGQDPAPVASQEPDEAAIAKQAKRQESARSRREREARAERKKSTRALARAHQRALEQPSQAPREETFTMSGAQLPSFGETEWNAGPSKGGSGRDQSRNVFFGSSREAGQRTANVPSWQQGDTWKAEAPFTFGQESSAAERAPASSRRQRAERRSQSATRRGYRQNEQEYRQAVAPERSNQAPMGDRPFSFDRRGPGQFVDADTGPWRGNWNFGR